MRFPIPLMLLFIGAFMALSLSSGNKTLAPTLRPELEACSWNEIELQGKVQFVESFADIKIQMVSSFPDLKVKLVESFPNECGKWQVVESFPDFTVQVVESFPDLKIQMVESFPGTP